MSESLKKMRLNDLSLVELHAAERMELVIRDDGSGAFEVLKDREFNEKKYDLEGLLERLRKGPEDGSISILWVKR